MQTIDMANFIRQTVISHDKINVQSAKYYNELKREMAYLCKGMPNNTVISKLQYKIEKNNQQKEELLCRAALNRPVSKDVSYADRARIGTQPTLKYTSWPIPSEKAVLLESTKKCRQNYSEAFKAFKKEREEAKKLAQSIAARHPKHVYKVVESKDLIKKRDVQQQRTLINRQKRFDRRHPAKEVSSFKLDLNLMDDRDLKIVGVMVASQPEQVKWAYVPSPKQIKKVNKMRYLPTEAYLKNSVYRKVDVGAPVLNGEFLSFLLFKLRIRVLSFREPGVLQRVFDEHVVGQMDVEGTPVDNGSVEQSGNVAIQSGAIVDHGDAPSITRGFSNLAVAVESQTYKTITDRWLHLGNWIWKSSDKMNSEIFRLELPYKILKDYQSSQMAQILLTHRFFRFDMEVKIILNSSPFQTGMLVIDWVYGNPDDTQTLRNVVTAMHRNHGKLTAGSSNDVVLDIPYHHFNAYLSNVTKECIVGSLSCHVLNILRFKEGVANQASLTAYVRLKNIDAHGLISRAFGVLGIEVDGIQGQMMPIASLLNTGQQVLRTAGNLFNQDKPPLPLQPVSLIPQACPSFSYTDGIVEPINVLRGDPRGQRPSPFDGSEMSLMTLVKCWGFFDKFSWRFSDVAGKILWSQNVKPLMPVDQYKYQRVSIDTDIVALPYPPIAVLASLASKCRGDIEYKFEIVANGFYTGSLQISSIPLYEGDSPKLSEGILSSSIIFDIRTSSTIPFVVPWNWFNAWMRTPNLHNPIGQSFAKLFVSVLNPLIAIDGVPTCITLNVYIRGGDNFEVCQFRTPLLCPIGSMVKPPKGNYLTPYNFETKWYCTSNRNITSSDGRSMNVAYVQNVQDGWVGYLGVKERQIYILSSELNDNVTEFRCIMKCGLGDLVVQYGIYHPGLSTANAHGLVLFANVETVRAFIRDVVDRSFDREVMTKFFDLYPESYFRDDGDWSMIRRSGGNWIEADNRSGEFPVWTAYDIPEVKTPRSRPVSFELIEPQMDTVGVVTKLESSAPGTSFGAKVYGESMPDIKGMARRWVHYGSFVGKTCEARYPRDCRYLFKFPVMPDREIDAQSSASYDNRYRDGAIPTLNELYAFWDGGMRYRLILSHDVPVGSIYVQHRFDDESLETGIIVPEGPLKTSDMMDTHYPTFVQATSVNPILTVEVPYKRSQERLLTKSKVRPINNGYLYTWIHTTHAQDVHVEIYYSVADDFQWSVFQGVPPLMDLTQLKPEPQMDTESNPFLLERRPCLKPYFSNNDVDEVDAQVKSELDIELEQQYAREREAKDKLTGQGIMNMFGFTKTPARIDHVCETADVVLQDMALTSATVRCETLGVSNHLKKTAEDLQNLLKRASDLPANLSQVQKDRQDRGVFGSFLDDLKGASFDYMTHLVYCILNPNGKTIGWAIVNIYRNVWGFSVQGLSDLVSPITNLWNKCATSATEQPQPTGQMEDADISSLCSLLYCSLCSLTRMSLKPPTSWSNIAHGLFEFSNNCRGGSMVARFIKDNIELLRRVWHKLMSYFSLGGNNYALIAGVEDARLKRWLIHSTGILNPSIREKVLLNPLWAEKAFELSVAGRALMMILAKEPNTLPAISKLVSSNMVLMAKLETELVNRKVFSGERYEPFCLWMCGPAGSGKTRILQEVAKELADVVHSKSPTTYHTITVGQQYFDGFIGQPSVMIDDFLAVSPSLDTTAAMFLQMKSSALFNPPYSDVKDKARIVNFYNLLISSNFASVGNLPGIHDNTAYNRRRDCLLECIPRSKPDGQAEWTLENYDKMDHCDVRVYEDPIECNRERLIERRPGENYKQKVIDFIRSEAQKYHAKESASYIARSKARYDRIRSVTNASSLEDYLAKVTSLYDEKDANNLSAVFGSWYEPFVEHMAEEDLVLPVNPVVPEEVFEQASSSSEQSQPQPSTSGEQPKPRPVINPVVQDLVETAAIVQSIDETLEEDIQELARRNLETAEKFKKKMEAVLTMPSFSNPMSATSSVTEEEIPTMVFGPSPQEEPPVPQKEESPKPQMETSEVIHERYWPYQFYDGSIYEPGLCNIQNKVPDGLNPEDVSELTDLSLEPWGPIIEPFKRDCGWPKLRSALAGVCHHRLIKDPKDYVYDSAVGCFVNICAVPTYAKDVPKSFAVDSCYYKKLDDGITYLARVPNCIMNQATTQAKDDYCVTMVTNLMNDEPAFGNDFRAGRIPDDVDFPKIYLEYVSCLMSENRENITLRINNRHLSKTVDRMQAKLRANGIEVGGCIIPKESRMKRVGKAVWKAFIIIAKSIDKILSCLQRFTTILMTLSLCGLFGAAIYNSATAPVGNVHPSGDYKTMRSKPTAMRTASQLVRPNILDDDGVVLDNVNDSTIMKLCKKQFLDPSTDGRLKKIVSNVFTLVGLKHLEGGKAQTFNVRCIGLRNYEFLCVKHYIDHFKQHNIDEVCIVYRKAVGLQRFSLKDIEFEFIDGGYGVGRFPSLARPFKNIVHLIPSEKFDGNYPHRMFIVEVNVDDIQITDQDCVVIQDPIYIPQNKGQDAWTIHKGFTYNWGGAGRCGSFLFSPDLACPLVGIHTAGIREIKGYSELLLRETFGQSRDFEIDFIEPQMNYDVKGLDMPGDAYVVGHLEQSKAVHLAKETKIRPSEIHGVFPIVTGPAPLCSKDVNFEFDPLLEGLVKRCDKPKEFPRSLLKEAANDVRRMILVNVKPQRNPGVLTIKESIEGLTLPGYDPLEIKTSEGYPWVLDRPKGATDKSWLFKFEEYPDKRRKVVGISEKLFGMLNVKQQLREKRIVPVTYYTACLKDARLALEKVKLPGKTRLFEMSPVDLTIAQRQYYLDFYVAYGHARLQAENTIGINPDGPEWSELARELTTFSPYIITADYSGYGPRLLMSVQKCAYDIENDWYEHHQRMMGISKKQIEEQSIVRRTMAVEQLNPFNVIRNCVVQFNVGMPSGNCGTVQKNSECNSIYIRVIYLYLAEQNAPHFASMFHFSKFIKMFCNGDDLIIAVKETIISWFNNCSIIEAFADFNIKVTDALKTDGSVRPYCSLEEATYLKRGFLKHPTRLGQYLAPLEENSITDTANWIWRSVDTRTASLVNSEMCIRLAYTRGPDYYEQIVERVTKAWLDKGILFRVPTWRALDMHIWEEIEGPTFSYDLV